MISMVTLLDGIGAVGVRISYSMVNGLLPHACRTVYNLDRVGNLNRNYQAHHR